MKYPASVLVRLTSEQRAALEAVQVQDGVNVNEQIRRAIAIWLDKKRHEHKLLAKQEARRGA